MVKITTTKHLNQNKMAAKLSKKSENLYILKYDYKDGGTTEEIGLLGKLSLKNCQAIANGYDLDELAKIEYPICEVWNDEEALIRELAFKKGFQKALEILGDKKFTEDDVKLAIEYGIQSVLQAVPGVTSTQSVLDNYTQPLKQTEWDVVVEMDIDNPCPKCGEKDNVHGNYDYSNITRPLINTLCNECSTYFSPIPKLDADGCLILKLKSE